MLLSILTPSFFSLSAYTLERYVKYLLVTIHMAICHPLLLAQRSRITLHQLKNSPRSRHLGLKREPTLPNHVNIKLFTNESYYWMYTFTNLSSTVRCKIVLIGFHAIYEILHSFCRRLFCKIDVGLDDL